MNYMDYVDDVAMFMFTGRPGDPHAGRAGWCRARQHDCAGASSSPKDLGKDSPRTSQGHRNSPRKGLPQGPAQGLPQGWPEGFWKGLPEGTGKGPRYGSAEAVPRPAQVVPGAAHRPASVPRRSAPAGRWHAVRARDTGSRRFRGAGSGTAARLAGSRCVPASDGPLCGPACARPAGCSRPRRLASGGSSLPATAARRLQLLRWPAGMVAV